MATLIGISGSLRKGSLNTKLLRAASTLVPDGSLLEVATLHGIPLYDADEEADEGIPEPVTELKERIAAADGLLVATPEYNNSIPGVLKNAIDYLSRPPKDIDRVFGGRPVALIGATPGGRGTLLAQTAWLPIWRTLGMHPWHGKNLYVARAHTLFDEDGRLTDDDTKQRLTDLIAGFCAFADRLRS